jgi:uncharacterized membrane protein
MSILLQADAALFLGRFHPLAVHLPIGFLLLAVILFALSLFKNYGFLLKALPIILLLGAVSSVAAAVLGWLLSTEGGYQESTLQWHQWMGISVAVISLASWVWISSITLKKIRKKDDTPWLSPEDINQRVITNKRNVGLVMALLLVLISITGHLGGNLTHGEQYLFTHAPTFIQTIFNSEDQAEANQIAFPSDPDSTLLFAHLIQPVLDKKCASCHNESKMKGGLLLTTQEGLLKGGENGAVLEKGSPQNSELFKRVCLDPASKKFMPPRGAHMSYTEIALLNYWITSGMSFDLTITDENIPEEIQLLIQQGYSLATKKKPFIEKEKIPAASNEALASLRAQGYRIQKLAEDNNFLEVVAMDSLTKEKIEALLTIKEQITWLDLGQTGLQDSWVSTLQQFTNLTRLTLDNNAITDAGIAQLGNFEHLESINLHATQIGDAGLKLLAKQSNLKRLYVWQTKVTQQAVDSIRNENPALVIDLGIAQVEKPVPVDAKK